MDAIIGLEEAHDAILSLALELRPRRWFMRWLSGRKSATMRGDLVRSADRIKDAIRSMENPPICPKCHERMMAEIVRLKVESGVRAAMFMRDMATDSAAREQQEIEAEKQP